MSIKSLPAAARPREKLLALGPQALADVELLALLLRTGLPGQGVMALAESVLKSFDGWAGLLNADASALQRIKGLGPAKRAELAAVMEMARRALEQRLADAPVFDSPAAVKQFVALAIGALSQFALAQTTTPAPQTTPQTKPATPPATSPARNDRPPTITPHRPLVMIHLSFLF